MQKRKDNKGRVLKDNETQMPDGRYRFRYYDKDNKRKAIYSWRLIETDKNPQGKRIDVSLREKEKQILQELNTKQKTDYTFNDYFEKYLEINTEFAITTKDNYICLWKLHIKDAQFAKKPITEIKFSDISKFYMDMKKEYDYAVSTIKAYHSIISASLQLAVKDGIISSNPSYKATDVLKRLDTSEEKEALSRAEQKELQLFLENDKYYIKYYPIIMTLLATGARKSEILGLTWDDIDFKNKTISINHQIIYKFANGVTRWYATKLKWAKNKKQSNRVIPVHQDILDILKEHKQNTEHISISADFRIYAEKRYIKDFELREYYNHFVFINSVGATLTPSSIDRALKSLAVKHNKKAMTESNIRIPIFSAHTLRYTFATRNAENGMDIKVLQSLMGHKNIITTMDIYNKVNDERKRQEVIKTVSPLNLTQ